MNSTEMLQQHLEKLEADRDKPRFAEQLAMWQYLEQLQTNVLLTQLVEPQGGNWR